MIHAPLSPGLIRKELASCNFLVIAAIIKNDCYIAYKIMSEVTRLAKKKKKNNDTKRRYNPEWEYRFPWVRKLNENSEFAFCKLCLRSIGPKHHTLKLHELSETHKRAAATPFPPLGTTVGQTQFDGSFAGGNACYVEIEETTPTPASPHSHIYVQQSELPQIEHRPTEGR